MNLRTTIALLVIVAAGVAVAMFVPSFTQTGRITPPRIPRDQGSQAVLNELRADALQRIEVRQGDRVTILERAEKGAWTLPGKWPARSAEVNSLVDLLCHLRSRFRPEARPADRARFGLEVEPGAGQSPPIKVVVKTLAGSHTLLFGEPASNTETNRFSRPTYVRVDDKAEVLRLAPGIYGALERPTDYYQQRRLFAAERVARDTSSQEKVERLSAAGIIAEERRPKPTVAALAGAGPALLLHPQLRDSRFQVVKKDRDWEMSVPVRDRLDPTSRDSLLSAVPDLWAERFVEVDSAAVAAAVAAPGGTPASPVSAAAWLWATTPRNAAAWIHLRSGLNTPERVLTVTNNEGQPVRLLVGKVSSVRTQRKLVPGNPPGMPPGAPPREEIIREEYRFAQLQDNPQVFEIRADKLKDVFVEPAALRDTRLARFSTADTRRIEIDREGRSTVLVKDKERWKLEQPIQSDADSGKVNELLDKLTGLEARKEDIRDVAAAPGQNTAALEPFGLATPAALIKVTVEEEALGTGDEKKKKSRTLTFAVGKADGTSKKVYVRTDDWPRINAVDESLLPLATRPALTYRGNRLFDFSSADLAIVEVHKDSQKLVLQQEQGKWRLTAPFSADADVGKAGQIAAGLAGLEVIEYVSDAPSASELDTKFGLGKPSLRVTMTFAGKSKAPKSLFIGKARDGGKPGFFARLGDNAGVFAINNDIHNFLERDPLAYLPSELWRVTPEEVTALRIRKGPEAEYSLSRSEKGWQITGPFTAAALAELVQAALGQLAAPQVESYKSHDDKELARVGLDKPVLSVSVKTADGKERSLLIGAPVAKDSKSRYAKLGGGTAIFVVGEPIFLAADKTALSWLDPIVIKLETGPIDRIVNRYGDTPLTLDKHGAGWRAVNGPGAPFQADEESISSLLGLWLSLKAEKYAAYGANVDLGRFGLAMPAHAVTVRAAAEGKSVEHTVELGGDVADIPGARYARLDRGPGVFVLNPAVAKDLARNNLAFVNRSLLHFDSQSVVGFTRRGRSGLELSRQDDSWRLVKPVAQAADDKFVQDLFANLSELRASRIAAYPARDLASFGLDDSAVVATIKMKDGKALVLRIGKPAGDNGDRFVLVEGSQAVGVVPARLAHQLLGSSLTFRDRNLARFPDADRLQLERGQRRAQFARIEGSWKLTEPLAGEADQEELDEFLNSLARLRADELVTDKLAAGVLAGYGLERPEARWRVLSGDKDILTLLIGTREKDGQRCYAKLADRDLVFLLDPKLSSRALGEFRTRTVWTPSLDAAQVESLRYTDARGSFVLEKNPAGAWQVVNRPELKVVAATVTETLDALAELKLARYAMDKDADFKLYGLDPPQSTLEIATRSGKRIIQLGRPEGQSRRRYARVLDAGRTDVIVLGESDLARIARDAAAFTRPPLTPPKPTP